MAGSVTLRQRLNRLFFPNEFRMYRYLWQRVCRGEFDRMPFSLPGMINKFGDL